ncbi:unnamed protein product [Darwinula stevensoni]|uniref:Calponin-homology (CH) domain-containing protein n=1 Tax=Darwinula stevensoni TaxID=69355 RepID=A0A7R9AAE0_9CRUS|nr:unnamed protein product [Darwinula stevensoni]CAG0898069.1 unnamed protein product [Darwinula stevensoni]
MGWANMEVGDLFEDLADGKKLLKLLEILSGERLPKPNNGRMRVQMIDNLNICLNFIKRKVAVGNIEATDIVDGKPALILGLIWSIIFRFKIEEVQIEFGQRPKSEKVNLFWEMMSQLVVAFDHDYFLIQLVNHPPN